MKRVIEVEKKLLDKLCSTENFFQSLAKHNIIDSFSCVVPRDNVFESISGQEFNLAFGLQILHFLILFLVMCC